jgi:hypothetical protein
MKYLLSIFSIALVLCGTQSAVHGAIVMTIDSSAETISFSGSDTGSAKQVSDSSRLYDIAWTVGTGGTSAGNLNVSSLFTSSSPDASFVSMTVGFTESRFTLNSVWDSNDQSTQPILLSDFIQVSFTGLGNTISYAGIDPAGIAYHRLNNALE